MQLGHFVSFLTWGYAEQDSRFYTVIGRSDVTILCVKAVGSIKSLSPAGV